MATTTTATMPPNEAAWITGDGIRPFKVGPGPQPAPEADEVVIKVAYVAINPSEWKFQDKAYMPVTFPHVLGSDVAGTVQQLGANVTGFKVGQRVIGHCAGLVTAKATDGGFQRYTTCKEIVMAEVPDWLPLEKAVVLPLAISTAATGLFDNLALPLPSLNHQPRGKTVLIWGGASSCGSTAIQLAVAAGFEVATTASAKNFEYARAVGATKVFNYTKDGVEDEIVQFLKGTDFAGAFDCIGEEHTTTTTARILSQLGGGSLPLTLWPPENLPSNVKAEMVWASKPFTSRLDIGEAVWRKYVPAALASGKLQAKPDPHVIKGGLAAIQGAVDLQKKGVSAMKIVVEIESE